jgi:hypothetical protein
VLVHGVLALSELEAPLALLDADELVVVVVHLGADVLVGRQPHHGELHVLPGEDDRSKCAVPERLALDVTHPADHRKPPFVAASRKHLIIPGQRPPNGLAASLSGFPSPSHRQTRSMRDADHATATS